MKFRVSFLTLILLIILASCGQKSDSKGIILNVEILPETITDELYAKLNYEFTFSDKFKGLAGDYVIFVHFWRPKSEEMLMVDDHVPQGKRVSEWKQGDSIKYSRLVFIPKFLNEFDIDFEGYEEIDFTVGLYLPGKKKSKIELFKKTLQVKAASYNAPEVIYDEGWWQVEEDPKIKRIEERVWRWTTKRAVCIIEDPGKECLLILAGRVDKMQFKDQKVTFKLNEKVLDEFIPERDAFEKRYIITPEMMGKGDEFSLAIETDKTFIPSEVNPESKDSRELGLRIFRLYFREHIK